MIRASQKSLTGDATGPSSRELGRGLQISSKPHAIAPLYKSYFLFAKLYQFKAILFLECEGLSGGSAIQLSSPHEIEGFTKTWAFDRR